MDNVKRLSEIEASPIRRSLTGFQELDYIYGYSKFPDCVQWGMPQGKISLWSGMGGTGKSRLCIDIVKRWSIIYPTGKILYFMTESPLSDFASWVKDTSQYPNIFCSGEDKIDKIIEIIYHVNPDLVFIDSVNQIEDFNGSSKSATRLVKGIKNLDGTYKKPGFKKVINDIGGHLVLLGQLNDNGSIKGGTALPHLVDVALDMIPTDNGDDFIVKVGIKNRHGKKNASTIFTHIDSGVINVCKSRLNDKTWRESHGMLTPNKGIGPYIGDDGLPTDTISPAMQKRMDKLPVYTPIGNSIKVAKPSGQSVYQKIGNFLGDLLGQ